MAICLERGANGLPLVQLMRLPPIVSCSLNNNVLTFLVLAYPGCRGKEATKRVSFSCSLSNLLRSRIYDFQLSSIFVSLVFMALLSSAMYFPFSDKLLSMFNLFLPVAGFPIIFTCDALLAWYIP